MSAPTDNSASLTTQLQKAGVSCRALAAWCRCGDGHKDRCEECWLDGPGNCAGQVIEALHGKLIEARHETNEVEQQVEYWKGLTSRMADKVMA